MRYMNDWDLAQARRRFHPSAVPNRAHLVEVVEALREWANANSDGWAYWPKPCRAASKAMALIESTAYPEYQRREDEDATGAETKAALVPIKAFLTRQGVPHSVVGL
jgi:hypothetical protein